MKQPSLYIFSGLPGSGKSTLAKQLARHYQAAYMRIDTIEQGIRDLCNFNVQGEGYRLAYRIAYDNLKQGISVVSDSCNPIELTRKEWIGVAIEAGAFFVNIEVVCSNIEEHRRRVETRSSEINNLQLPTWQNVIDREYHEWDMDRIVIDTFNLNEKCAFNHLLESLSIIEKQNLTTY